MMMCDKYPCEIGIPDFDGDRLDILPALDDVSKTDISDAVADEVIVGNMHTRIEPTFQLYIVTIQRPFELDFVLIKASSEENAWNIFWEKIKDEPNFDNDDDLGKKECYFNPYEDDSTRFVRKNATIRIDIEKIDLTKDKCFKYIGGGRSV